MASKLLPKSTKPTIDLSGRGGDSRLAGRPWWLPDVAPDDAARIVHATLEDWSAHQQWRARQHIIHHRLYAPPRPSSPANVARLARMASVERLTHNVVQSCIDTLVSKIGTNRPKPMFLTSGGDFKAQRRAKMMNRFVEGLFYEAQTYRITKDAFRDACIDGDGIVHVYNDGQRVRHERVRAIELWIDEVAAELAPPREMHRVKVVDRDVLLSRFPEQSDTIQRARFRDFGQYSSLVDVSASLVTVVESWRLPSGPDAKDGAHLISVSSGALTELEPWDRDTFPFARLAYTALPAGFWSQGLAEALRSIQLEINKLCWVIQRSLHLAGTFKIWKPTGSNLSIQQLNNDLGSVIESDQRPDWILPQVVQPEVYAELRTLVDRAYEVSGVSRMNATGTKPAGLNSGVALRTHNDINSERFLSLGQAFEQFHLDIAQLSIAEVQALYDAEGNYSVRRPHSRGVEVIHWKDIRFERDDQYVIQVFPVSSLPSDPAGRRQTIQEFLDAGFIDEDEARELLDFPDLERVESLRQARREWTAVVLDRIVEEGKLTYPEPYDDLDHMHSMALAYYQRGKVQQLPEDRLELLRQFIAAVQALQTQAGSAMPTEPPGGPALPGAPEPPADPTMLGPPALPGGPELPPAAAPPVLPA